MGARQGRALKAIVKRMSYILSLMGSLWTVLSKGVSWCDLCYKKKSCENGLKEDTRILLAWVQESDNDSLDWKGGSGV